MHLVALEDHLPVDYEFFLMENSSNNMHILRRAERTMNTQQLKCFVTVAKYLNFSKAAEELYMTQTAMTYQIATFEKEIGTRLFNRTKRSVKLTGAGEAFLPHAVRILEDIEQSQTSIRNADLREKSFLRLGTYGDVLFPILPKVLADFRSKHPNVLVTLQQGTAAEIAEKINSESLDIGILTGYGNFISSLSWLDLTFLFSDIHCAVVPRNHPLAKKDMLTEDDLRDETLIVYAERDVLMHDTHASMDYGRAIFLNDPQSVTVLVEAGYGISVCVSHVCPYGNPNVACIPIRESKMDIYACNKKDTMKGSTAIFLESLKRYIGTNGTGMTIPPNE